MLKTVQSYNQICIWSENRAHHYIKSAKGVGGWDQKMPIFADIQSTVC